VSDVIGKGVIEVSADTSKLQAGIEEGKRSIKSLGASTKGATAEAARGVAGIGDGAGEASGKVDRATKQIVASIQRATAQAQAGERGARGYFEALAQQRGANAETLKPYLDQLEAVSAKQVKTGISAGQMTAALRGVPAQFTDIATSIAGGQQPLTVFLQQGGQLKDMFGGAGNAARALGGYVVGLINPFTVAAAAAGVLAVAYNQGSKESDAYVKAIALSGNAAGVTKAQLAGMAEAVAKVGGTQAGAAEALAALAGSGRVAGKDLERFAVIAQQLEKTVGIPIADTVKDLAELGKSPLEASEKLTEKFRYLTAATYQQIKAAQEQGRTDEAAALAQNAYATAMKQATDTVQANLGTLEKAWKGIAGTASKAWDTMLGVGRKTEIQDRIAELEKLAAPGKGITNAPGEGLASNERTHAEEGELRMLKARVAEEKRVADERAKQVKQQEAAAAFAKESDKYLSKAVQTEREITRARELGNAAGLSSVEIEKRVADIKAKAAGENAPKDLGKARLGFDLDAIKRDAKVFADTYANIDKVVEAQRASGIIKDREYYAAKRSLLTLTADAQEEAARAEIARLQQEKTTGKDQVENARKVAEAEGKLAELQANRAANAAVLTAQETAATDKLAKSYRDATVAAESYIASIKRQNARDVAGVGRGNRFRDDQNALNRIEDKRIGARQGLESDLRGGKIDQTTFDTYLALAEQTYQDEVSAFEESRVAIRTAQSDWTNGASEALENYRANAENVAGATASLFTGIFDNMTNGIASSISRAIVYGEDLGESLKNVALGVADAFIAGFIRIQIQRMFLDKAAAASYASTMGLQAQAMVSMAGLNAFASTAAIPIVGPAAAPAAAAAAVAFAETFAGAATAAAAASVASARGGFDVPAGVNPLTQLHEREMVLPRRQADVIREMARNPGGAGGGAITIVNNTSAKIGRVSERPTGDGGRALVLEEAVDLLAGQMSDPNSRVSRALGRNFNLQRNR
jgi:phage-related minor tail protein